MKTKEEFDQTALKRLSKGKKRQHKIRHKFYEKFYKHCLKALKKELKHGNEEVTVGIFISMLSCREFYVFDTEDKRNKAIQIVSRFIEIKHQLVKCEIEDNWLYDGNRLVLKIKHK